MNIKRLICLLFLALAASALTVVSCSTQETAFTLDADAATQMDSQSDTAIFNDTPVGADIVTNELQDIDDVSDILMDADAITVSDNGDVLMDMNVVADMDAAVDSTQDTLFPVDDCLDDPCPFEAGIEWRCQKRFMYGVNYAWKQFASDFGGLFQWGLSGVSGNAASYAADLADMHDHGINVIRWFVLPEFRSDGVVFDSDDRPLELGGSMEEDLQKALELAQQNDVYLMLCLFSFDGFRATEDSFGVHIPGMSDIATDATSRKALVDNVVKPIARIVEASPYRHRMIAWDIINEPEWAMVGSSLYGDDMDFDYQPSLEQLTHEEMETFIDDVLAALRLESSALITVGSAGRKWLHAWQELDLDFYQFHLYEWVNGLWPYTDPVSSFAIDGKPVLIGEFPSGDLAEGITHDEVLASLHTGGYAGAMTWQYTETTAVQLDDIKAFADQNACQTRYGSEAARGMASNER